MRQSFPPLSDRFLFGWVACVFVLGSLWGCLTTRRMTYPQLSGWCAVQQFQLSNGRTFDSVRTLGNRERIAVRQDRGRLTCLSLL